jgi:hypothetical protein
MVTGIVNRCFMIPWEVQFGCGFTARVFQSADYLPAHRINLGNGSTL